MSTEPQTIEGEAVEEVDEVRERLPAVQQHSALVARDEITVAELVAQRDKIVQAMDAAMKPDVHYGKIPGVDKPTLWKPGAELLNVLLRLAPSYRSERTWHDDGHLTVVSYCTLTHIPTGLMIAAGEGLCSTLESKYAYRQGGRQCPECGSAAIIKGKPEYGGGWICFKKKGGCGAKFADGTEQAQAFETAEVGRVPNEDLPDSYNTVLKMADKRALIAAVLNGTAASDVFTQDVEDGSGSGDSDVRASSAGGGASAGHRAESPVQSFAKMPPEFEGDNGTRIMQSLNNTDPTVDWPRTFEAAIQAKYGKAGKDLGRLTGEAWARLAHVAVKLAADGDFPPPVASEIAKAFGEAFGIIVPTMDWIVYREAAEAPLGTDGPAPVDDDIPFGDA